ncbi:MAG: ribokinase [Candidatus Rokuibacteriota bacterium]
MSAPRVLVIGSANVDFVVAVERLPAPGETVSGGTLLVNHGGKGANQAVAARRLGAEVRFVGCVGDDTSGSAVRAALTAEGIEVTGLVTTREAATGTALIVVDAAGRNQIAVAPGANHRLTVEAIEGGLAHLGWAQVLVCQLETPLATVQHALAAARARGVPTVLNPAPVQAVPDEIWPLVDYLTPNETETAQLSGQAVGSLDEARAAGRALAARGSRMVIVTLGEKGALACGTTSSLHVPALPVSAVDTTAAGDAFNAALAVGVARGQSLGGALRFAAAAAGLACTRRGAQDSLPRGDEVEAALIRGSA